MNIELDVEVLAEITLAKDDTSSTSYGCEDVN